jgi:hypothetical protein
MFKNLYFSMEVLCVHAVFLPIAVPARMFPDLTSSLFQQRKTLGAALGMAAATADDIAALCT